MWRRFDVLHPSTIRQIFRRHVRPFLAFVPRDIKGAIVRSRPDHNLLDWRFSDRIKRAVKLLACNVACDRFTTDALATIWMRGQIGRDAFPRHAFVSRTVNVLRAVVKHIWIVRRRGHRRYALHAIDEIARGISVKRLAANPVILLLSGLEIHHAVLSLARAVNDVGIHRMRHDWASLTSWTSAPISCRERFSLAGDDERRVILLCAVEFVRKLVVHPDAVDLRGGLVHLR